MSKTHFSITPASIIALATLIAGQIAALVPTWAPQTKLVLQLVTALVPVAFLIANAIIAHGEANKAAAVTTASVISQTGATALHVIQAPIQSPIDSAVIDASVLAELQRLVRSTQSATTVPPAVPPIVG